MSEAKDLLIKRMSEQVDYLSARAMRQGRIIANVCDYIYGLNQIEGYKLSAPLKDIYKSLSEHILLEAEIAKGRIERIKSGAEIQ